MKQRAADHQRFLVGEQQALAGARRGEVGRQAGGADDRRHHRVDARAGGDVAQRLGAGEHSVGSRRRCERCAQARGRVGVARSTANAGWKRTH